MANPSQIAAVCVDWLGTDPTFMARIQGIDASYNLKNLQQADVATITYTVYDTTTGLQTGTGTLTVAAVMFNTLQTNTAWTADALGFNFAFKLLAAGNFPIAGRAYNIAVTFVLAAGGAGSNFVCVFQNQVKSPVTGN